MANWQTVYFNGHPIRMTFVKGKPYFVGIDAAKALGYKNPSKAVREIVGKEDKFVINPDSSIEQDKQGD